MLVQSLGYTQNISCIDATDLYQILSISRSSDFVGYTAKRWSNNGQSTQAILALLGVNNCRLQAARRCLWQPASFGV